MILIKLRQGLGLREYKDIFRRNMIHFEAVDRVQNNSDEIYAVFMLEILCKFLREQLLIL